MNRNVALEIMERFKGVEMCEMDNTLFRSFRRTLDNSRCLGKNQVRHLESMVRNYLKEVVK